MSLFFLVIILWQDMDKKEQGQISVPVHGDAFEMAGLDPDQDLQ